MGLVNVRNAVRAHLFRERFEVLLAVLIPFLFMAESGYANAWVFAGGHLGLDFSSLMAYGRGFAIEAFIFVCFRLVRIFGQKKVWNVIAIPLLIGMVAMVVSAGMNLGWMSQSPEMQVAMGAVQTFMPGWMANIFRVGLGLLFPVGVGLFALFDVRHLIDEMINSAHLDNRALHVHRSELHRTQYLKSIKRAKNTVRDQYDSICEADAQNMVNKVRQGDLSFGAEDLKRQAAPASVTRISPAPPLSLPPGMAQRSSLTAQPTIPLGRSTELPPMPSFAKPRTGPGAF